MLISGTPSGPLQFESPSALSCPLQIESPSGLSCPLQIELLIVLFGLLQIELLSAVWSIADHGRSPTAETLFCGLPGDPLWWCHSERALRVTRE